MMTVILFLFVFIVKILLREVAVLYAVLAQDAIQAALKDYKSKNEGTDEGQAQSSANWMPYSFSHDDNLKYLYAQSVFFR